MLYRILSHDGENVDFEIIDGWNLCTYRGVRIEQDDLDFDGALIDGSRWVYIEDRDPPLPGDVRRRIAQEVRTRD